MNLLKGYNTQISASTVKSASLTQADIYSGDSFRLEIEGIRRSYIQLDQVGNQQDDITLSSKATEKRFISL